MSSLNIAIIDDNENDVSLFESQINEYSNKTGIHFNIKKFNRGITFVEPFQDIYDAIFLDIDMPVQSGLETAKKLRELHCSSEIIFVTNYASLAINGYGVNAFGFLVKPVTQADTFNILDKLITKLNRIKDRKKIVVKVKSGYQTIFVDEIKYVEVVIHDIFYYCNNAVYKTRGALKDVEDSIKDSKFVRCSNCYLINLDYIDAIVKDDVKIDGKSLKIARSRKKEFVEAFLNNFND